MFRITVLALALLMPMAAAQADDEACTQEVPCEWVIDLDADGFDTTELDGAVYNGTVGDWYIFSILNADEAEHTLTWEGYGLSWTILPADVVETQAFLLDQEGQFFLEDAPSGDAATIQVFLGDVVDTENDAGGASDGPGVSQPFVGAVLVGLSLLALVAVRR